MDIGKKKRVKEFSLKAFVILCIGFLYALIYMNTDFRIPCIFNLVTGLLCPGCGVSAMCIRLLNLNFKEAFFCNPGLMLALPLLILFFTGFIRNYLNSGSYKLYKWQKITMWLFVAYFILYGIIRNIFF